MPHIQLTNVTLDFEARTSEHVSAKRALLSALKISQIKKMERVQALNGINLHIRDGARVGLYGPNGSGKTTLLRMIAGVYPITSGTRSIEGSCATLLGIGLGSHPDMSAYDNIKMMLRLDGVEPTEDDIAQIWEFTEIPNEFLFMPLRSFSTGMVMRVLFSIVTSKPKEILLMDEWLGVADEKFQVKAEKRMQEFVDQARILVIASHNMGLLQRLCHGVVFLEKGKIVRSEIFDRTANLKADNAQMKEVSPAPEAPQPVAKKLSAEGSKELPEPKIDSEDMESKPKGVKKNVRPKIQSR